jgi:hypothetical protein
MLRFAISSIAVRRPGPGHGFAILTKAHHGDDLSRWSDDHWAKERGLAP